MGINNILTGARPGKAISDHFIMYILDNGKCHSVFSTFTNDKPNSILSVFICHPLGKNSVWYTDAFLSLTDCSNV